MMSDDTSSSSSEPKIQKSEEIKKMEKSEELISSQINTKEEEKQEEVKKDDPVITTSSSTDTTTATTTTSSTSSSSFGGWFTNFVQSAKEKVNKTTMDSIRRDLNELKDAVQLDTTKMVYSTASIVKNTINEIGNSVQEISSLGTNSGDNDLDYVIDDDHHQLNPKVKTEIQSKNHKDEDDDNNNDDDEKSTSSTTIPFVVDLKTINSWTEKFTDTAKSTISMVKDTLVDSIFATFPIEELDEEPFIVKQGKIIKIENWKQLLKQLQSNAQTYCNEPDGPLDDFDQWLVKFNLINYQKQIQYLLETVPEIKNYYDEFVIKNGQITDQDFWNRYFYKVYQLKEQQSNLILNQQSNNNDNDDNNEDNGINTTSTISRSSTSTEDWEKISHQSSSVTTAAAADNNKNNQKTTTVTSDNNSNDEDREWVKCD